MAPCCRRRRRLVKRARGGALAASREAINLPAAADPAKPLPAGIAPGFVTSNADFYRVDTALTVPRIDVDTWRLRIHGMVDRTAELSFDDLLDRPLIERDITLNCVSNEVGGPYIGTARWLGVPLAPLLRELGVQRRRRPGGGPLGRGHDHRHAGRDGAGRPRHDARASA